MSGSTSIFPSPARTLEIQYEVFPRGPSSSNQLNRLQGTSIEDKTFEQLREYLGKMIGKNPSEVKHLTILAQVPVNPLFCSISHSSDTIKEIAKLIKRTRDRMKYCDSHSVKIQLFPNRILRKLRSATDAQYERRGVSKDGRTLESKSQEIRRCTSKKQKASRTHSQRSLFEKILQRIPNTSVSNTIDDTTPPTNIILVDKNIFRCGVQQMEGPLKGHCSCRDGCRSIDCECMRANRQYRQYRHIFECNSACPCSKRCSNRKVQRGSQHQLDIFKTMDRGWGLRCHQALAEGEFIDLYVGEIYPLRRSQRQSSTENPQKYVFELDKFTDKSKSDIDKTNVCDASKVGGRTRFINHSCEPNSEVWTVSYHHEDYYFYKLALFTREKIEAMTEITYDYESGFE